MRIIAIICVAIVYVSAKPYPTKIPLVLEQDLQQEQSDDPYENQFYDTSVALSDPDYRVEPVPTKHTLAFLIQEPGILRELLESINDVLTFVVRDELIVSDLLSNDSSTTHTLDNVLNAVKTANRTDWELSISLNQRLPAPETNKTRRNMQQIVTDKQQCVYNIPGSMCFQTCMSRGKFWAPCCNNPPFTCGQCGKQYCDCCNFG